jgi:hypothetical protein
MRSALVRATVVPTDTGLKFSGVVATRDVCVFHAMPVTDFTACRSKISRQANQEGGWREQQNHYSF